MNKNLTSQRREAQFSKRLQLPKPQAAIALFLGTGALVAIGGVRAIAQELPGCFLRTDSGKYVRLNSICVFPETQVNPAATASAGPGVYQAQIIRRQAGIPVIEVTFNENQTFEMLVDTGASGTAITPAMAEALGVIPTGRGTADTPSQRNAEFQIGSVQSIGVGGAKQLNVPVAIAPALETGLLGQDFFGRYDVTIKEDVIEFRERG